ncbi:hypothetical protein BJ875DRAFT_499295 [Amylocarpus encephaloides]|uniref:Uncharacterized protein n=1 Tax=Amylocarpus encephaloides TaxID=45428 RepID=A0A9P7YAQ3_9HELO|nr:hypothetical protein BJ875DRAFT_499295 [Amylocarpus encephaloides]
MYPNKNLLKVSYNPHYTQQDLKMNTQPRTKQENESLSVNEIVELAEYKLIIKFAEDVEAGRHPRVKLTGKKESVQRKKEPVSLGVNENSATQCNTTIVKKTLIQVSKNIKNLAAIITGISAANKPHEYQRVKRELDSERKREADLRKSLGSPPKENKGKKNLRNAKARIRARKELQKSKKASRESLWREKPHNGIDHLDYGF